MPLLKKGLLFALAILAAVGIAEIFTRVSYGARVASIYAVDSECLHRLVPGAQKSVVLDEVNGGATIEVRVNSAGYRGAELRGDSARRIAVFGDSFVAAEFSSEAETFVQRLAGALPASDDGSAIECVNAGVIGYGPDQCLLRIERELDTLKPALLIIGVFAGNDFGDLVRNKLFGLDDRGELQRLHPVIGAGLQCEFDDAASPFALYRLARHVWRQRRDDNAWQSLRTASVEQRRTFATQVMDFWLDECRNEYRDAVQRGDLEVRNLLQDHFDADVAVDPDGESSNYKTRLMGAVLGRIGEVARAAGIPCCVVAIPSVIDVHDDSEIGQVDLAKYPSYERGRLTATVAALAETAGLPALDLFPAFRSGGREQLYWNAPETHWNGRGQDLAARELARFVTERGLLPD